MNDFTLNGAEIDGEPQIWLEDDCFATFNMAGDGSALFATPLGGISSMQVSPSWPPQIRKFFAGESAMVFTGGLPLSLGYSLIGDGQSAFTGSGELLRKAMVNGDSSVVMQSDFTALLFTPPKADFFIQMHGSADIEIAKSVFGEYIEPLVICDTESRYQPNFHTHHGSADSQLRLNANGKMNVWMYSPSSSAIVNAEVDGSINTGGKVELESNAQSDGFFAKGDIGIIRYVQIGSDAAIKLNIHMDVFIRMQYLQKSPNSRTLFVSKQDRTLTVTG